MFSDLKNGVIEGTITVNGIETPFSANYLSVFDHESESREYAVMDCEPEWVENHVTTYLTEG